MAEKGVKLLIADDEPNVRNGLYRYISSHSDRFERIYTAENGQEALDIILKFRPELMVVDVQMPYKDGLQVIREAQEAGICPKAVILSGYDEFAYAQQALRLGAVDYLLKPCRPTDLLPKLEGLLEEGREDGGEDRDRQRNPLVEAATKYIDEHFMEDLNLSVVAEQVGITAAYLSTLFSQVLDMGFVDYLNKIRINRACAYLYAPRLKTYEVAHEVGFKDEKYFTKVFKKITGKSPSQYRKELDR